LILLSLSAKESNKESSSENKAFLWIDLFICPTKQSVFQAIHPIVTVFLHYCFALGAVAE
jgi:hypothetical protein